MIQLFEYHKIDKKQSEVDFLIPLLDIDRRFCLDPSLLRFSSTSLLQEWNQEISDFLKLVHHVMKGGNVSKLENLLNIGEAPDAGLGYCAEGVSGSGFGQEISKKVIAILSKNKVFVERGFIRLEELQWMDTNIGPDRVSDLVINILKRNIIDYTQQQAKLCGIPVEEVRINKVFEPNSLEWVSLVTKLPINPKRTVRDAINPHPPLLLLPKETVKTLPLFLNYDDFYGFIDPEYKPGRRFRKPKIEVVRQVIDNPALSADYIRDRETNTKSLYRPNFDTEIQKQIALIEKIPVGSREHANQYRDAVKEVIDFVFDDLSFYKKEKSTILGENRRDLIYQNNATFGIFSDFKGKHSATHIVFDTKNTDKITSKDVAQISNYLNDDIGLVGFIVSRKKDKRLRNHSYVQLSKHNKVILFISDEDLKRWVTDKTRIQHKTGQNLRLIDPVKSIANMYSGLVSD